MQKKHKQEKLQFDHTKFQTSILLKHINWAESEPPSRDISHEVCNRGHSLKKCIEN